MNRLTIEGQGDVAARAKEKFQLTTREQQVLKLAGRGLSDEGISRMLRVKVHTVRKHLWNICLKTGVKDRSELVYRLSGF